MARAPFSSTVEEILAAPRSIRRRHVAARWLRRALEASLTVKLAGANGLVILVASIVLLIGHGRGLSEPELGAVLLATLLLTLLVNVALTRVALRPLRDLELTAARVWEGDLAARVPASPVADREMRRVGETINILLDRLLADRARVRELAAQVIRAGDEERARIARELHDSIAQTLAAVAFQASSAYNGAVDPVMREQLELVRDGAVEALEEARTLSLTVHPSVLDDLGVAAALEWLARRTREHQEVEVTVSLLGNARSVPPLAGSVLYTIAQEAVLNAVRHGAPHSVEIVLSSDAQAARLDVIDDGSGFDLERARFQRPGMGLFAMEERARLADGGLEIDSRPGRGTRVTATIPFNGERTNER